MSLLEVKNLCVDFATDSGSVRCVDNVSFNLDVGQRLGIVGESGSGKSLTSLAIMGLIPDPGTVTAERLTLSGIDLLTLKPQQRRKLLGKDIAMIFQDPMTSLNPCFTVGDQIEETLDIHQRGTRRARRQQAIELLEAVGIPDAPARIKAYPHQLSGGMCQRVMIAIAIACQPKVLIADEPTTALDVTIQAQILELLLELNRERGMGLILITHDLAVVSQTVDNSLVMYCGQVVESGQTERLLSRPHHPYTQALLEAVPNPQRDKQGARLTALPGNVPLPTDLPTGCRLAPRCPHATEACQRPPELTLIQQEQVRCIHPLNQSSE